jgi:putative DNA primase/helicase
MTSLSGIYAGVNPALQNVLSRLRGLHYGKTSITARCPAHEDTRASLSIGVGDDGRVLLKCFAGCRAEAIVSALNLTMADLFNREEPPKRQASRPATDSTKANGTGLTVALLAERKKLPLEFLRDELGWNDLKPYGVAIPYFDRTGENTLFIRERESAKCGNQNFHQPAGVPLQPYGLWRLNDAAKAGFLIPVEGESDTATLWHHEFPALGLPGAGMYNKLESEHLTGVKKIYISHETDSGGDSFVAGIAERDL